MLILIGIKKLKWLEFLWLLNRIKELQVQNLWCFDQLSGKPLSLRTFLITKNLLKFWYIWFIFRSFHFYLFFKIFPEKLKNFKIKETLRCIRVHKFLKFPNQFLNLLNQNLKLIRHFRYIHSGISNNEAKNSDLYNAYNSEFKSRNFSE